MVVGQLDQMIVEVFSNRNDPMILYHSAAPKFSALGNFDRLGGGAQPITPVQCGDLSKPQHFPAWTGPCGATSKDTNAVAAPGKPFNSDVELPDRDRLAQHRGNWGDVVLGVGCTPS